MWRLDLTDPSHWSRGPKMTFPRWDPQTIVLDGKLYALGFLLATDCPLNAVATLRIFLRVFLKKYKLHNLIICYIVVS